MLVPAVIVLHPAVFSFPIPFIVLPALIAWRPPPSATIWRPGPVTLMPLPVVSDRIPIAFDPNILGSGLGRKNADDTWRRRRADSDANRNLSAKDWSGKNCRGEQCDNDIALHVGQTPSIQTMQRSDQKL